MTDKLLLLSTVVAAPIAAVWMHAPVQYRPDALDAIIGFGIWTSVVAAAVLRFNLREHHESLRFKR